MAKKQYSKMKLSAWRNLSLAKSEEMIIGAAKKRRLFCVAKKEEMRRRRRSVSRREKEEKKKPVGVRGWRPISNRHRNGVIEAKTWLKKKLKAK
jgi:hypothetical protein